MMLAILLVVAAQVTPPQGLVLFALAPQQSNGSGRAPTSTAPPELLTPHLDDAGDVDIFVFGNDYVWRDAVEPIDSAAGQVDVVSVDGTAAVGPSMAFALAYVALHPGVKVGLIPCAKGSTTIHEWRRQSLVDSTLTPIRSNLYGSCLHRINVARAYGELGGVLGFQGESDARPSTVFAQPTTYAAQFIRWVKVLRADLGMPRLPVVFAQLGPTPTDATLTAWDVVKTQQVVARNSLEHVGMIVTDDLAMQADGLHFTSAAYATIGDRFAIAMTAIETQP